MNYLATPFLIIVSLSFLNAENVDQFYTYVSSFIKDTETYIPRVNNQKLFETCDSRVHNFGSFDFIIVGAGAAGSVLANRLSEKREWKILLLEAGGELNKFSDILAYTSYLAQTDMNWGYLTTPQSTCCQGMINRQCVHPRGKVIGGSTTLNYGIYARGSPEDYDEWAEMGIEGWSYKEILPYFKKSEHVAFGDYDQGFHGRSGQWYVNKTYPPSSVGEAFLNANLEKGLHEVDFNGRFPEGVCRAQFNIRGNRHDNNAHAFLDPIRDKRKNLQIVLRAAVNKLVFEGTDAIRGVTFVKEGKVYEAKAKKEVILSAGAINTPQLLLLSGIGPKDELEKLKIHVLHNFPAVGKHLQDHVFLNNLVFRTNTSGLNHTMKENLERYLQGMTPLTNGAGNEYLAFLSVNETNSLPDVEFVAITPPLSIPGDVKVTYNYNEKISNVFKKYNPKTDLTIFVALMKPKSEGTVTLQSNSILDFPLINVNYFSDPRGEDLETLYRGIKHALSLVDTEAFKRINATYIGKQPGCENLKDDERKYWYCAIRHYASTEFHPSCTTRMGHSTMNSVVDSNCLVHNFRNLRIVDAGVLPSIIRGHLNAPVNMIAEKISDVIKAKYDKL